MDFILLVGKFIGALIVAVVVIILMAILGFRFWISRVMKKSLSDPYFGLPTFNPARINLTAFSGETAHQMEVNQLIQEANGLGYELIQPNHLFESDSWHGIYVYFLQNSTKTAHIAIYDSENLQAPMIDIMQCYEDKIVRGVSNSPFSALPYPSNIQTVKLPKETTLTELLEYKTQAFTTQGLFVVEGKKLSSILEQLYAIQQDYLIHLNFADYDYVKEQVDAQPISVKKKQTPEEIQAAIKMVQDNMREGYEYNIPIVVKERFLKETKMDALEWQKYEEKLIVIHERQTAEKLWEEHFQNCFIDYTEDDHEEWGEKPLVSDSVMAQLEDLQVKFMHRPLDYVSAILPLLPANQSFQKLGKVQYPLHAELYYFE